MFPVTLATTIGAPFMLLEHAIHDEVIAVIIIPRVSIVTPRPLGVFIALIGPVAVIGHVATAALPTASLPTALSTASATAKASCLIRPHAALVVLPTIVTAIHVQVAVPLLIVVVVHACIVPLVTCCVAVCTDCE